MAIALGACTSSGKKSTIVKADINNKTKFSSKTFGVAASPRLTTSKNVKRGGGYVSLGKPYKVRGRWYTPKEEPGYDKVGTASWYGPNFHGRLTANGEIYDQYTLSAAHPTMPLPSYARVTNTKNGRSAIVRVNDRGPYSHNRLIDLSSRAADVLDFKQAGTAKVRVQYIGRAPLHGQDVPYLEASIRNAPSDVLRDNPSIPGVRTVSEPSIMVAAAPAARAPLIDAKLPVARPGAIGAIGVSLAPPALIGGTDITGSIRPKADEAATEPTAPKELTVAPADGDPFQLPGISAKSYAPDRLDRAHTATSIFAKVLK